MAFLRRWEVSQYHEAVTHARRYATRIGLPVELRKWDEFGTDVLILTLLARYDTPRGEVIEPNTPHAYRRDFIGPWEPSTSTAGL